MSPVEMVVSTVGPVSVVDVSGVVLSGVVVSDVVVSGVPVVESGFVAGGVPPVSVVVPVPAVLSPLVPVP